MRVVFVTHSLPPPDRPLDNIGGMQRGALELTRALAAHPRVALTPITLHTSTRWEEARTAGFLARLLGTLPRRVRRAKADVVFFSSPVTASLLVALRPWLGRARTASITHGLDVTLPVAPYQVLVRRLLRTLDVVFPLSQATAEECLKRGAPPERVCIVPFGVDTARFAHAPDRAAARRALVERLRLPPDAFLLASVGRQVRRKGTAWFVEHVMPRLPPEVHYLVAGQGPELERVRELAAPLGGRVRLLGRVSEEELLEVLGGSDLFVMPNVPVEGDMEGQGLVLLEAALCGLPAVASGIEGIRDVVTEGENGHLLPPTDAEAFAATIERYVADRAALDRLSASARAHVEREFSWPAVAERYVRALERVLAGEPLA